MDDALWAFGRVSGFVSMVLLTVALILGILTRSGRPLPALPGCRSPCFTATSPSWR
ncbi:hypothetical protein [Arthrobacter sp. ERGS1:01]|uniref:hypothetical protein n=1 Tax=Arthrobacter sp. ERGS1:01 TaxID=1704044 RepID=UPI001ED98A63|nr:hypothetical protein [Arthrobacter sp. ERGS1:01]